MKPQPTFKEQYDKIVNAYLKNELKPLSNCACFIGNLLNNTQRWAATRTQTGGGMHPYFCMRDQKDPEYEFYTIQEICNMENNFLINTFQGGSQTEEKLFAAMESTLLMLRSIHESKGEVVQDYIFSKRELQTIECHAK